MYLKEAKKNSLADTNQPAATSDYPPTSIYKMAADNNIDSIAALYGVEPQQIDIMILPDGRKQMKIPVKKIHTTRFYDNLNALEQLYGTSKERIKRINGLKGDVFEPACEIIIPL